ncbi:Coiled-coil domain-containing protein 158 [Fukomys damarensis]|uniref:Coiled-coil domain-containing protein 158 n=1 Tax=Fukomys damarensis TaxID=885580 RepID=A0A091DXN9_FUKDA|nr:Coiled-coil domain-containing protein 158 [Fukomys damarensis]
MWGSGEEPEVSDFSQKTLLQVRDFVRAASCTREVGRSEIEELEKQLVLANSELTEARTERDQFSQESGNLDDQLQKLLADLHMREKELSLEKEQNKRLWDRDTGNSITIDHLRWELDDRNMEVQRLEALLKAMKSECQSQMERQSQCEALRLQMAEKDKVIEILRQQIENMTQLVGQHGRTAGAMQVEKAQLEKEINDRRLELHEFKILKDKKDAKIRELEARVSVLELEKVKLVNAGSERLRVVRDSKQERDQLLNEAKNSRSELNNLSGMLLQFQSYYSTAVLLEKAIRVPEEGHLSWHCKRNIFLKEEKNKLSQELSTVATEKNKMAGELEVLQSQERRLKEKVANMEVALDKVVISHISKELQGPGFTSNSSMKPRLLQPASVARAHSNVPSSQSTASFLSRHSGKTTTLKEDPTKDLKQLLQELRSVINEEPAVQLSKAEDKGRAPSLGALCVAV